ARFAITNATATVTLDVRQDFIYSSEALSVLASTGTGTVDLKRHLQLSDGTLSTISGGSVTFMINGSGVQNYTGGIQAVNGSIGYSVEPQKTFDLGEYTLTGASFTLKSGATLHVGSPDGLEADG